ncbi:MAG: RnfABCDGE type electron transport complex subunit D [Holophagales bacterium]|nr:RnfABCDGE type electron transport complex subunit D [Holophagales bacterium]
MRDPRDFQIASLLALNLYGLVALDFEVRPVVAATLLATALAAQWAGTRWAGLLRFDPKSALVSGLGLCMLLRTASPGWAALAAALAIGSKFAIRLRGKHVFNPTDFALVALLACGAPVWVSPGQWGSEAFLGFLAACCAFLVLHRSERSDVTVAFLVAWTALLVGRSLWLAEPMAIPLHRLENGALLIFAFFMISDPKTIPDSRPGRLLFAGMVASGAFFVQFGLFRTNGLLYSLAASALLVPLIDLLLPGERHRWPDRRPAPARSPSPLAAVAAVAHRMEKAAVKGGSSPASSPVEAVLWRPAPEPFRASELAAPRPRGPEAGSMASAIPPVAPAPRGPSPRPLLWSFFRTPEAARLRPRSATSADRALRTESS